MKKLALIILTLALFSFTETEIIHNTDKTKTIVYICGKSDIYHNSKTHAALKRCKTGITEITEVNAQKSGKRICKCKS